MQTVINNNNQIAKHTRQESRTNVHLLRFKQAVIARRENIEKQHSVLNNASRVSAQEYILVRNITSDYYT